MPSQPVVSDQAPRPSRLWLSLFLLLTLVTGLLYLAVIPPWQGPDETGHFEYAWLLARLGRLPKPQDASPAFERELLGSLYEWRYGEYIGRPLPEAMPLRLNDLPANIFARQSRTVLSGQFSLSYLWQALFLLPTRSQDLADQLRVARLSSVLINVGITWLAFLTFSELTAGRRSLAYAMTAILVLVPQHTFVNSMVGDGPLAELLACLVFYCWARLFGNRREALLVPGILLGTVAALFAKGTAGFLVPLDIGLAVWYGVRRFRLPSSDPGLPARAGSRVPTPGSRRWHGWALTGMTVVLSGMAVWLLGHVPSPLGVPGEGVIRGGLLAGDWIWRDPRGFTFTQALLWSHDSFWAYFGWMSLPVSQRWYGALLLAGAAAAFGWVVGRPSRDALAPRAGRLAGAAFLTALVAFVWFSLLRNQGGYYQFQGRYLFPAAVPAVFLLAGGWERVLTPRGQRPGRWPEVLVWGGVGFLLPFAAWCILGYILPFYHSS
jgi:hypothetical protein